MRRPIIGLLAMLAAAGIAFAGTLYKVGSSYDVLQGTFRYQLPAVLWGHCRSNPVENCDSNNGGGGFKPCGSGGDICEFYSQEWETNAGVPNAWVDNNGAFTTQQSASSQRALLLGAVNGSIFGATNTGWFGIQLDTKAGLTGCSNYGLKMLKSIATGSPVQTIIGTLDGCAQGEVGAQLAVINANAQAVGVRIRAASGQGGNLLQTEKFDSSQTYFNIGPNGEIKSSTTVGSSGTIGTFTFTRKLPIYNDTGTLLGYVPILTNLP